MGLKPATPLRPPGGFGTTFFKSTFALSLSHTWKAIPTQFGCWGIKRINTRIADSQVKFYPAFETCPRFSQDDTIILSNKIRPTEIFFLQFELHWMHLQSRGSISGHGISGTTKPFILPESILGRCTLEGGKGKQRRRGDWHGLTEQ